MFEELENMEVIEKKLEEARVHLEECTRILDTVLDASLIRIKALGELVEQMADDYQMTDDIAAEAQHSDHHSITIANSMSKAFSLIQTRMMREDTE